MKMCENRKTKMRRQPSPPHTGSTVKGYCQNMTNFAISLIDTSILIGLPARAPITATVYQIGKGTTLDRKPSPRATTLVVVI